MVDKVAHCCLLHGDSDNDLQVASTIRHLYGFYSRGFLTCIHKGCS